MHFSRGGDAPSDRAMQYESEGRMDPFRRRDEIREAHADARLHKARQTLYKQALPVRRRLRRRISANALKSMRFRGRSSVVERQLPKLYVVGSIPIARSNARPARVAGRASFRTAFGNHTWLKGYRATADPGPAPPLQAAFRQGARCRRPARPDDWGAWGRRAGLAAPADAAASDLIFGPCFMNPVCRYRFRRCEKSRSAASGDGTSGVLRAYHR